MSMVFDCVTCGACCSHKRSWPVLRRDRSDAKWIPQQMVRHDLPLLKTDACGRCVALRGNVGERVACWIYEDRPVACKNFQPGGMLCLEARGARL